MTGAIILGISFGIDVTSDDDPYITGAETALHSLAMTGNIGSYTGPYPTYATQYHLTLPWPCSRPVELASVSSNVAAWNTVQTRRYALAERCRDDV